MICAPGENRIYKSRRHCIFCILYIDKYTIKTYSKKEKSSPAFLNRGATARRVGKTKKHAVGACIVADDGMNGDISRARVGDGAARR
jgi:hypothetical protein